MMPIMPEGFGPLSGVRVGHAADAEALTGSTVLLFPEGAVAACQVLGGATGERELETLQPTHLVERIDALVFAGGSAFGLDAAGGVMRWCEEHEMGFNAGVARVPIVPAAIVFDLRLAGRRRPDAAMGYAAAQAAMDARPDAPVLEGNAGAGTGCTVGKLFGVSRAMKAGIGCWTERLQGDAGEVTIAALAVVNAFGDVLEWGSGQIIAGARRSDASGEFVNMAEAIRRGEGRSGFAEGDVVKGELAGRGSVTGGRPDPNTVLVAVATDAALSRAEASRVARMAAAGMARAISPAHTTYDGDVIFVLSVGNARADLNALGIAAADAVARAILRGVTQAHSAAGIPGLAG
jgi:L-aminopeptidase/D-esterase-like protein